MSVRDMAMTFEAVQSYMRKDVKGVNLTLVIHPDDVPEDLFRQPTGSRYQVAMVLINDQEQPVMPKIKAEGQKAVSQAGLLCREKSFWAFLGVFTEEEAVKELKARLDIISRSELANNKIAREGFRELVNEFNRSY
jgi:hypothetical protein|tara:strand:- start:1200 stop:1607 length:408 start_codon:yes stop_codon:yes gene_type:complete